LVLKIRISDRIFNLKIPNHIAMAIMKRFFNKYYIIAVLFFLAAVICIVVPLIVNMNNFVAAALVISGLAYFILGSFAIIFSDNESFDPRIVGLLPVQGCINLCRITSNSLVYGSAYFVPMRITGEERVMQYNPESLQSGNIVLTKNTFSGGRDRGLLTVPSCDPLIRDLRKRNAMVAPKGGDEPLVLLDEALSDVLEFTDRVTATWEDHTVRIVLHNYRFIDGCRYARSVSPQCCTRFPCPAGSLCGSLIAEGVDNVVRLESCEVSSQRDVIIIFSYSET
jgi:hypothetical protein